MALPAAQAAADSQLQLQVQASQEAVYAVDSGHRIGDITYCEALHTLAVWKLPPTSSASSSSGTSSGSQTPQLQLVDCDGFSVRTAASPTLQRGGKNTTLSAVFAANSTPQPQPANTPYSHPTYQQQQQASSGSPPYWLYKLHTISAPAAAAAATPQAARQPDLSTCFSTGSSNAKDVLRCVYLPHSQKLVVANREFLGARSPLANTYLIHTILQPPPANALQAQDSPTAALDILRSEADFLLQAPGSAEQAALRAALGRLLDEAGGGGSKDGGSTITNPDTPLCLQTSGSIKRALMAIAQDRDREAHQRLATSLLARFVQQSNDMSLEINRLISFMSWPHTGFKYATPSRLAAAGFYRPPEALSNKNDDRTLCFDCRISLLAWEPGDEPWAEHKRHSPNCPFVRGKGVRNVSMRQSLAHLDAQRHQGASLISHDPNSDLVATADEGSSVVQVWEMTLRPQRVFSMDFAQDKRWSQESNNSGGSSGSGRRIRDSRDYHHQQ
eukprot:m.69031 g.69031  ORF g.69031 m.69031 type:complete len:501 (+) comp14221_c0_seq1:146-1648(+)